MSRREFLQTVVSLAAAASVARHRGFRCNDRASSLTSNRNVLLTRRDNTLYVHRYKDPTSAAVKLKPIAISPRRATLHDGGRSVEFIVEMPPSEHVARVPCLRLRNLPVNEFANTVMVVKLEFDELP
jgi:alpha-L-fucosidase